MGWLLLYCSLPPGGKWDALCREQLLTWSHHWSFQSKAVAIWLKSIIGICVYSNVISVISPSDAPQLSGSEKVTVEIDAKLALWCDILANPPVQSVSWKFNGTIVDLEAMGLLETTDGFNTKLSNGRVVKSLHEGTYECLATHPMYGLHKRTFHVTVTGQFTQSSFIKPELCAEWPVISTAWNQHISGWIILAIILNCRQDLQVPSVPHDCWAGGGVPHDGSCCYCSVAENCKGNAQHTQSTKADLDSPKLTHLMLYSLLTVLQIGFPSLLHQVWRSD